MAHNHLAQAEADSLIAREKHVADDHDRAFPTPGSRLAIPLVSADRREAFSLDITRSQVRLTKATYQTRARQVIILLRLDLDGPPHRNPDGEEIPCPHLHIYREDFGDKWAIPAPSEQYRDTANLSMTLDAFMDQCNVARRPRIHVGLF